MLTLMFYLLLASTAPPLGLCYKSKNDDIIIVGGDEASAGPFIMDKGSSGRSKKSSSTIIIIPQQPSPPPFRRDPFMDNMFGSASFDSYPMTQPPPLPPPPPHHHHHQPPPVHMHAMNNQYNPNGYMSQPMQPYHMNPDQQMMNPQQSYFPDPGMPIPSGIEFLTPKKKKKKKKKVKTTTTTTTTTSTTPAPTTPFTPYPITMMPQSYASPMLDNFYFTTENGYGMANGASSYNMPSMTSSGGGGGQYGSQDGIDNMGRPGGMRNDDRNDRSNTIEFPKFPQIIIKVPAPIVNVPQPIVNIPAAMVNVSVPEIRVPTPQITVPAPIVNVPTPIVNVPAANVTVNIPNIDVPPAIVNVPKKLVLKKELNVNVKGKGNQPMAQPMIPPISAPMPAMRGMTGNAYGQGADSHQINFDDDDDDEETEYSPASSSHRQSSQDKMVTAKVSYSNPERTHPGNGQENQAVNTYVPVLPPTSRSKGSVKTTHEMVYHHSYPPESSPVAYPLTYSYETTTRPTPPHYTSTYADDQHLTPVQQHFSRSRPIPYKSPKYKPPVKVDKGTVRVTIPIRMLKHPAVREVTRPRQIHELVQLTKDHPTDGQEDQLHDNMHGNNGNSLPQQGKEVSELVTEKPIRTKLQVLRDERTNQPNIIFEKTDTPPPEAAGTPGPDDIIFDVESPNSSGLVAQNPELSQQIRDGIVFEQVPSYEFEAIPDQNNQSAGSDPSSEPLQYYDDVSAAPSVTHSTRRTSPRDLSTPSSEVTSSPTTDSSAKVIAVKQRKTRRPQDPRVKVTKATPSPNSPSDENRSSSEKAENNGIMPVPTPPASMPTFQLISSPLPSPSASRNDRRQ